MRGQVAWLQEELRRCQEEARESREEARESRAQVEQCNIKKEALEGVLKQRDEEYMNLYQAHSELQRRLQRNDERLLETLHRNEKLEQLLHGQDLTDLKTSQSQREILQRFEERVTSICERHNEATNAAFIAQPDSAMPEEKMSPSLGPTNSTSDGEEDASLSGSNTWSPPAQETRCARDGEGNEGPVGVLESPPAGHGERRSPLRVSVSSSGVSMRPGTKEDMKPLRSSRSAGCAVVAATGTAGAKPRGSPRVGGAHSPVPRETQLPRRGATERGDRGHMCSPRERSPRIRSTGGAGGGPRPRQPNASRQGTSTPVFQTSSNPGGATKGDESRGCTATVTSSSSSDMSADSSQDSEGHGSSMFLAGNKPPYATPAAIETTPMRPTSRPAIVTPLALPARQPERQSPRQPDRQPFEGAATGESVPLTHRQTNAYVPCPAFLHDAPPPSARGRSSAPLPGAAAEDSAAPPPTPRDRSSSMGIHVLGDQLPSARGRPPVPEEMLLAPLAPESCVDASVAVVTASAADGMITPQRGGGAASHRTSPRRGGSTAPREYRVEIISPRQAREYLVAISPNVIPCAAATAAPEPAYAAVSSPRSEKSPQSPPMLLCAEEETDSCAESEACGKLHANRCSTSSISLSSNEGDIRDRLRQTLCLEEVVVRQEEVRVTPSASVGSVGSVTGSGKIAIQSNVSAGWASPAAPTPRPQTSRPPQAPAAAWSVRRSESSGPMKQIHAVKPGAQTPPAAATWVRRSESTESTGLRMQLATPSTPGPPGPAPPAVAAYAPPASPAAVGSAVGSAVGLVAWTQQSQAAYTCSPRVYRGPACTTGPQCHGTPSPGTMTPRTARGVPQAACRAERTTAFLTAPHRGGGG